MPHIDITSDDQWHKLRARNIGGSDIAALFGLSPFTTAFSLWHEKAGKVPPHNVDNQKTNCGKLIEPLIAQELGRELDWKLDRSKVYWEHENVKGAGCTLDFDVLDHQWGPGIVETKVVFDYADYKRDWSDERAPPNYELQAQHQMFVTGRSWCAIAVWIAQTATLAPALIRRPNEKVQQQIKERIEAFWASIAKDAPPPPSGTEAEVAIMSELWPKVPERKVVEIADPALTEAASLYRWANEQLPGLEREKTSRKAQILFAANGADLLRVPDFDIKITKDKERKDDKRSAIRVKIIENKQNGVTGTLPTSTINAG